MGCVSVNGPHNCPVSRTIGHCTEDSILGPCTVWVVKPCEPSLSSLNGPLHLLISITVPTWLGHLAGHALTVAVKCEGKSYTWLTCDGPWPSSTTPWTVSSHLLSKSPALAVGSPTSSGSGNHVHIPAIEGCPMNTSVSTTLVGASIPTTGSALE